MHDQTIIWNYHFTTKVLLTLVYNLYICSCKEMYTGIIKNILALKLPSFSYLCKYLIYFYLNVCIDMRMDGFYELVYQDYYNLWNSINFLFLLRLILLQLINIAFIWWLGFWINWHFLTILCFLSIDPFGGFITKNQSETTTRSCTYI